MPARTTIGPPTLSLPILALLVALAAALPAAAGAAGPPHLTRLAEIELPPKLAFGPRTIKVTPHRLLVLGTHVSSRTLAAYDRGGWKLAWRYPGQVEAFVLCGDLLALSRGLKRSSCRLLLEGPREPAAVETVAIVHPAARAGRRQRGRPHLARLLGRHRTLRGARAGRPARARR